MLRHAFRSLKRTPVFTAAVILTLALGVGSAGAMFTVAYGVLLAPLPYGHPDRLVGVGLQTPALQRMHQSPAIYYTYKRFARRLADIGFYRTGNANIWTNDRGDPPERVTATWVTASTIPLLEAKPLLGRTFTSEETRVDAPNVVILSESVWRTRFGAARDVVGKTLYANSVPREIIGVMPDGFAFPTPDTRLWLPVRLDPASTVVGDVSYSGVARLADDATPEDAQRELSQLLPRIAELFPRLESGATNTVVARGDEAGCHRDVAARRDDERHRAYAVHSRVGCGSRIARRLGERREPAVDPC